MSEVNLRPLFSWRREISKTDLPATTKHVALALSLYMNEAGGSCFPSHQTLAVDTSLHADTVKDHLRRLHRDGWLAKRVVHRGEGRGTRVDYEAVIPASHLSPEGAENTGAENPGVQNTGAPIGDQGGPAPLTTGVQDPHGISPVTLNTSHPDIGVSDDIEEVLDQAARMVVEHRQEQGWRKAGAGAVRAARERLDRLLAEEWLLKGHGEHEVARCLAARVIDPDSHSAPVDYWQPPPPEPDEPVSLDRARELLGKGRQ